MSVSKLNLMEFKQEMTEEFTVDVQNEKFHFNEVKIKEEPAVEFEFVLSTEEVAAQKWEATAEENETLKCRLCCETFQYRSDFIVHKRVHKPDDCLKEVKCHVCAKDLLDRNYQSHHRKHHNKQFQCDLCKLQFHFKNQMIGHVKRFHTGIKKFVCEECGKSFSVKPSYKDHMLTHSTSDPKPFKCVICPKSFASKGTLSVHLKKTHKNDRIHHCDFPGCNFSAKGYGHFYQHQQRHTKNYECLFCDEKFSTRSDVSYHSFVHRTQKTKKCAECDGKMVKTSGTYTRQNEIFKCANCEAIFEKQMWKEPAIEQMRRQKAQKHVKLAVGKEIPEQKLGKKKPKEVIAPQPVTEGMFLCTFCSKQLTSKRNLEVHIEHYHNNTKLYRCTICDFTTTSHPEIWKHRNEHILPYVCKICCDKYATCNQLYAHYEEDHDATPSKELVDWIDVKEKIDNAPFLEELL